MSIRTRRFASGRRRTIHDEDTPLPWELRRPGAFSRERVELEFSTSIVYFEDAGTTQEFVEFYATHFGPLVAASPTPRASCERTATVINVGMSKLGGPTPPFRRPSSPPRAASG